MGQTSHMSATRRAAGSCCASSPSSMCFWTAVFVVAYGALLLLRSAWPVLNAYPSTLLLTALGVACLVNAARNRTYHCYLTAPLFLVAAAAAALREAHVWPIPSHLLWGAVTLGVVIAFVAEWRASRLSATD